MKLNEEDYMYNDMNYPDSYNNGMMNQPMMNPQIGFTDPYQAEMAMMRYRGPQENYYFSIDDDLMYKLGFTPDEISILKQAYNYYGVVTSQKLTTPPFVVPDRMMVSRIIYAYNICIGKKNVDTADIRSLAQHFKRMCQMYGTYNNYNGLLIPHRDFSIVPRVAVVAGIPTGNFFVLNSKLYDKSEATYIVDKIAQEWVWIQSTRLMQVSAADRLNKSYDNREWGIPDILKVEEVGNKSEGKPWKIKIHKKYCRLCNRFLIIATTRNMTPGVTEHHGGYQLLTDQGQILYLYAKTTDFDSYGNPKDKVPNSTKDTVYLDYGFYRTEIENKLNTALNNISSRWNIVYSERLNGDIPYNEIPKYSGMVSIRENRDETDEDADYEEDIQIDNVE